MYRLVKMFVKSSRIFHLKPLMRIFHQPETIENQITRYKLVVYKFNTPGALFSRTPRVKSAAEVMQQWF